MILGEGLSLVEAWDAMFTLSGAISWVSKQAQLNTNAVSLWKGQQLITQAITKWYTETRGPWCPCSHPPALPPFSFQNQDKPPWEERLQSADECWEVYRHTYWVSHHEWGHTSQEARTMASSAKNFGLLWPQHLHLYQTTGLRVMKVQHQLSPQCQQVPVNQGATGISTVADTTRSSEATWKSIWPSSRMKTRRFSITYQSWNWDIMVYCQAGCQDCTLLLHHLLPTGLSGGVGEELGHQHPFGGGDHCAGWAL